MKSRKLTPHDEVMKKYKKWWRSNQGILWADSAKLTFNNIVEYLRKEWTEKEVEKFINSTTEWLSTLKRYPEMCRPSLKRKNVVSASLTSNTQIVYHYKPRKKQIELLLFWNPNEIRQVQNINPHTQYPRFICSLKSEPATLKAIQTPQRGSRVYELWKLQPGKFTKQVFYWFRYW